MQSLFSQLKLADIHQDVARNIVSIQVSQDLFDDLSDDPREQLLAQQVEGDVKPNLYHSHTPIIDRPFEDAAWFNAINWPFKNWGASRFSDGGFGVWYGAESVETTVYETAYHWYHGLICDAGFQNEILSIERKVYLVNCNAALLDFRHLKGSHRELLNPHDYGFAQSVGARIHREGHPGLVVPSVRHQEGHNFAVFNPSVLSNPRHHCQLRYQLQGEHIVVEKQVGIVWLKLPVERF